MVMATGQVSVLLQLQLVDCQVRVNQDSQLLQLLLPEQLCVLGTCPQMHQLMVMAGPIVVASAVWMQDVLTVSCN